MSAGGTYVLSPLSAVTASRVAEAQVTELRELFACFDADRDGKLTTLELCSVIRALGHAPTSAELTALQMTVENVYGGRTCGAPVSMHEVRTWRSPAVYLPVYAYARRDMCVHVGACVNVQS